LNELTGVFRHCDAHFAAGTLQTPQHFDGLICGDAAGDSEGHTGSGKLLFGLSITHLEIEM
jgi:hypothetical protein